jgi:hypothetical protein
MYVHEKFCQVLKFIYAKLVAYDNITSTSLALSFFVKKFPSITSTF